MKHPLITIFGPPQSGKSSLLSAIVKQNIKTEYAISCLFNNFKFTINAIKSYDNQYMLYQMIDSSKISDIHILTIDGNIGVEVDTLEYISLIQAHSNTNIVVVITKSDKRRKEIKEVVEKYVGKVKIFVYIKKIHSREMENGDRCENYSKYSNSISNLMRYLSNVKIIETSLNRIPHIMVDRIIDNKVYGYLRGGVVQKEQSVVVSNNVKSSYNIFKTKIQRIKDPLEKSRKKLENKYKVYIPGGDVDDGIYIPIKKKEVSEKNNYEENLHSVVEQMKKKIEEEEKNKELKIEKKNKELFLFDNVAFKNEKKIYEEQEEIVEEKKEDVKEEIEDKIEMEDNFDVLKEKMKMKIKNIKYSDSEEEYSDKENSNEENDIEESEKECSDIENNNEENNTEEKKKEINNNFYKPGEYLEIEISEWLKHSKFLFLFFVNESNTKDKEKNKPVLLSGKITKHKFYKGYVESNDAYIVSLGLYKYQTTPLFYNYDGVRNRVVKILPELDYVGISLYAPLVDPSTPLSLIRPNSSFKICAYGSINGSSVKLQKPLRLIGSVFKIHHNSAEINNMFSSDIEVIRARNVKIQTASGIRGIIKNPVGKGGAFRATFEGPVTKSDIIILKTYVENKPYDIYKEVTDKILRSRKEIFEIQDKYKSHEEQNENEDDNIIYNKNNTTNNKIDTDNKTDIDNKTNINDIKIKPKKEYKNKILMKYDKKIEILEKKLTLDKRKIEKERLLPSFLDEDNNTTEINTVENNLLTNNRINKITTEKSYEEIKKKGIIKTIKNKKHKSKKKYKI
ncbi:hypothetical protein SLOPH_1728 [Spraguea lophii 42_110]|uniref:Ribosome biogenesis protein BMS1/TSR1 C-terminal domain-containing protein n=1 Tax=Spraguea lophii (strain 42_110) TaxID=1358809 RepID=S7W8P8_SPRLO|nr:hypothetical protein SLOPH_1728 [Spraguea lophii 42_110]